MTSSWTSANVWSSSSAAPASTTSGSSGSPPGADERPVAERGPQPLAAGRDELAQRVERLDERRVDRRPTVDLGVEEREDRASTRSTDPLRGSPARVRPGEASGRALRRRLASEAADAVDATGRRDDGSAIGGGRVPRRRVAGSPRWLGPAAADLADAADSPVVIEQQVRAATATPSCTTSSSDRSGPRVRRPRGAAD